MHHPTVFDVRFVANARPKHIFHLNLSVYPIWKFFSLCVSLCVWVSAVVWWSCVFDKYTKFSCTFTSPRVLICFNSSVVLGGWMLQNCNVRCDQCNNVGLMCKNPDPNDFSENRIGRCGSTTDEVLHLRIGRLRYPNIKHQTSTRRNCTKKPNDYGEFCLMLILSFSFASPSHHLQQTSVLLHVCMSHV